MRVLRALGALTMAAAILAACGDDSDTSVADGDTIEFTMDDTFFTPDAIEVPAGATVTLAFTNEGELTHEAVVGDADFQEEHEAEMSAMPDEEGDEHMDEDMEGMDEDEAMDEDMEGMDHEAETAISLEPGESGEITYTFEDSGTIEIGCHEPGHYDAGMIAEVTVT